jgi:hypothetical protein
LLTVWALDRLTLTKREFETAILKFGQGWVELKKLIGELLLALADFDGDIPFKS